MTPRTAAAIVLSVALAAARAPGDTNVPPAAPATPATPAAASHDAASLVSQALAMLASRGVTADPAAAKAAALDAVVRAADAGGRVMSADDVRAWERAGRGLHRGIGVTLAVTNGQTRIAEVTPGSPAAAVLRVGDLLDEVDGRYVSGFPLEKQSAWISGVTGATVAVSVVRQGAKDPIKASIAPADLPTPAVRSSELLPRSIGCVRVAGLWKGAAAGLRGALAPWRTNGCIGVILDLRDAGGSDADEAAAVAALTADPGVLLFTLAERTGAKKEYRAPAGGPPPPWPVMMLIGPRTTGAAEAAAASARAAGRRTLLIGQKTAGDALIREPLPFEGGSSLYVATRSLTAGASTPVTGPVEPQIRVDAVKTPSAATAKAVRSEDNELPMNPRRKSLAMEEQDEVLLDRIGGDPVLERAVDLLLALQAMGADGRDTPPNPER